jgi:hypothetical protein
MSTADLYADLIRRAEACEMEAEKWGDDPDAALDRTKARAYRHAAELLRGAVAAAVVEEREACAQVAVTTCIDHGSAAVLFVADAIRARGESPRGGRCERQAGGGGVSARVTVEVDDRWARVAGGRWHRLSDDREEAVRVAGFTLAPVVYGRDFDLAKARARYETWEEFVSFLAGAAHATGADAGTLVASAVEAERWSIGWDEVIAAAGKVSPS